MTDTLTRPTPRTIAITPGNEAPTAVHRHAGRDGTTWKVGDTIAFSGHATDPQQGTLPASRARLGPGHAPLLRAGQLPRARHPHWTGVASGSFMAPDHEYPSYLELKLVATDQEGLTHAWCAGWTRRRST